MHIKFIAHDASYSNDIDGELIQAPLRRVRNDLTTNIRCYTYNSKL